MRGAAIVDCAEWIADLRRGVRAVSGLPHGDHRVVTPTYLQLNAQEDFVFVKEAAGPDGNEEDGQRS